MSDQTSSTRSPARRIFDLMGGAGLIVGSRVAGSLLTLYYTFLLTSVAAPEEVGRAFAALSTAFLVSVVASMNVESGSIRFLPMYFEAGRKADAAGFVLFCRYLTIVALGLLVLVGLILLLAGRDLGLLGPYLFSLAAAPIMANTRINSRHATALGLVLQGTLPRILVRPILFSALLLGCVALDVELSATWVMAFFLVIAAATAAMQWLFIRHAMTFRKEVKPSYSEAKDWMGLGLLLVPMLVLNEYTRDISILSASVVLPAEGIARLGIALSLIGVLSFALTAVDMIFSPRIARALVQENVTRRNRLIALCGAMKLAGLTVGTPIAIMLIPTVLRLLGSEYESVRETFLIFIPMIVALGFFGPANMVLNVLGRRWELFWATLAGTAALFGASVIGGRLAGLDGVALGITVASTLYYALLCFICRFRFGIDTTIFAALALRRGRS